MPVPPDPLPRTRPSDAADASEPGACAFVLIIWVAMLAYDWVYVSRFAPNLPRWDDYAWVPVLVGERPATLEWLFALENEHRMPLPKLVIPLAIRSSHNDFRAPLFLNLSAIGLLALGMVEGARRLRGGTHYTDAFFPIVWLNLGHHESLLWAGTTSNVMATAIGGAVLLLILRLGGVPSLKVAAAAVVIALLPSCGATGLAMVPALVAWLGALAVASWRSGLPSGRARGLALLVLSLLDLAVACLFLLAIRRPANHPPPSTPEDALRTTLQFLSVAYGPAAADVWPYAGWVVPALLAIAGSALLASGIRRPEERPRALGLAAYLAGMASLALGLGWGRSAMGEFAGLPDRYVTMAVPTLCGIYFACGHHGGRVTRRLIPMVLLLSTTATLWPNTAAGLASGRGYAAQAASFERDIRDGVPLPLILRRHTPFLHPSQDALAGYLPMLRKARVGVFRDLKDFPRLREVAVPLEPTFRYLLRWEDGAAHVTGPDPYVGFAPGEPRFAYGIRVRYSHANPTGTSARFKLGWRRPDQPSFPPDQILSNWNLPTGPGRTTTVWACDRIAEIRIQPDNQPCVFRIEAIDLLVP